MDFNKREACLPDTPTTPESAPTTNGKDVGAIVDSQLYVQLRKLINVVDELRDIGLQQFIQLPRICVVGTQSAGKSSVLEAIVGLDFLPRGDGVVTRRPLELRLVHLPESEHPMHEAYAVFENNKEKKFRNFEEVRKEIDRLTDQVAGKNKGIIDHPIVLTIYATQCPDLSLIDLPGITRVPLKGSDQSDDIEVLTRQMALRYAADPRTIVLAVIPANVDMSTSDALQLARRVDPRGVRTIGVITKIDLMDRGTDAAKMLLGEEIPLRLGYTGVRNRSQADIREGKTVKQCLEEEKIFFAGHPTYRLLPPQLLGVNALIEKLTRVLFRHIKHFLPEIKREIAAKSRAIVDRLHELGEVRVCPSPAALTHTYTQSQRRKDEAEAQAEEEKGGQQRAEEDEGVHAMQTTQQKEKDDTRGGSRSKSSSSKTEEEEKKGNRRAGLTDSDRETGTEIGSRVGMVLSTEGVCLRAEAFFFLLCLICCRRGTPVSLTRLFSLPEVLCTYVCILLQELAINYGEHTCIHTH